MILGRWENLSLAEQLGNIGSEISRARHWEKKQDLANRNKALERSIFLIDNTISCRQQGYSLKEVVRLREVISDLLLTAHQYEINLEDIEKFCLHFGILARMRKN